MVRAQGGDPDAPLPQAAHVTTALPAPADGWLTRLDALAVGTAAWRLGAGRARKEDAVSAAAGVICLAKPGDRVRQGQPLLELRADDAGALRPGPGCPGRRRQRSARSRPRRSRPGHRGMVSP